MLRFIIRRLIASISVLFIVSVVVFLALQLTPGDPAKVMLGTDATIEEVQALRRQMGLDRPLPAQYVIWLGNVLTGDLGRSVRNKAPVMSLILGRLPATVELVVISLVIGLMIGFPAGILSAVRHRSWVDYGINLFAAAGIAIPSFWFGILLISLFSVRLRWLPASGYVPFWEDPMRSLRHVMLPAITLGLYLSAYISRFLRADLLEVLHQDYIRTARAKGLADRVVLMGHALPNSLISLLTILGILVGSLLGGVVIVEQVFGWSGIGWLAVQAIFNRDYPLVQGVVLFSSLAFVLINLFVDMAYGVVDPRIRFSR
ncbi:MAG: ABC transporter permease [Ardenticatenaceae bacterium]|nr:ABC transporter permease [Ardenticatenaceae bacterium]HBY93375.1 peptide ABC transporter [Chloroflexota bacterium]